MKQLVQNYRSGELTVLDVPEPACKPGGVLVGSCYSLISVGTELMKVNEAKLSLVGKARARPDQVRRVVESVAEVGPAAAYRKAMNRLDSYTPLGYSLSGSVVEAGKGAEEFRPGQLVACAGNEHALHAELNWVPVNLCVPVPDGVDARFAAFATVGSIALHGLRRAEVQLGETACVIGLGLIGQLAVQLLNAAGVAVVGLDPVDERCKLAEAAGALVCAPPSPEGIELVQRRLASHTNGLGADHVLLTAAGGSDGPVRAAAGLARDRARIIDIGKCRLDLPWNDYYAKELDLRFSRSYGPGRYDDRYELEGIDYPAGYVRWTERRNLSCFLDLVARGELDLEPLVSGVFAVDEAEDVYKRLNAGDLSGIGFLFKYDAPAARPSRGWQSIPTPHVDLRPIAHRPVRVGFIGAGRYASSMLLPHLHQRDDVILASVATTSSLSAANARRRFGFSTAVTDVAVILEDPSIDAVFIVTRHGSHADLASRALERGKCVFVEKPLALSSDQLDRVLEAVDASGNDRLMVGFNRRFAPLLTELQARFGTRSEPALARYLVHAGRLQPGSWYADAPAEGTRFEGEGGHFIDTLSWWIGARPVEVHAVSTSNPDDLLVTLRYEDASVATIAYTTSGSPRHPKEIFDVTAGGKTARLDNFRRATVWSGHRRRSRSALGGIDKGQRAQLERFLQAVRGDGPMPVPLDSIVATTRATLAVTRSRASGRPERV